MPNLEATGDDIAAEPPSGQGVKYRASDPEASGGTRGGVESAAASTGAGGRTGAPAGPGANASPDGPGNGASHPSKAASGPGVAGGGVKGKGIYYKHRV